MMHNYVMSLVISMQNVLLMLKNKAIRGLNDSWVFWKPRISFKDVCKRHPHIHHKWIPKDLALNLGCKEKAGHTPINGNRENDTIMIKDDLQCEWYSECYKKKEKIIWSL